MQHFHSITILILVFSLTAVTGAITVEDGVTIDMTSANSYLYVGDTITPDEATVYTDETTLGSSNISIINQEDDFDVNTTIWEYDTASYDPSNRKIIQFEQRLPNPDATAKTVHTNISTLGLSADQLILERDGTIIKRIEQGTGIDWSHSDYNSPVNFSVYAANTPNLRDLSLYPSEPGFDEPVTIEANVSHPDEYAIEAVNFTVWGYNDSYAEQKIDNQNGTLTQGSVNPLWNSTSFRTDVEKGTYNYSITVQDNVSMSTRTGLLFASDLAPPTADDLTTELGPPYNTETSQFRTGQTITGAVDIADPNGREDLASYDIALINPDGNTVQTTELSPTTEILNGYRTRYSLSIPDGATTGTWTLEAEVTDSTGLTASDSSTIQVNRIDTTAMNISYPLESGEDRVFGDSDYPYAIHTGAPTTSGLVGYDAINEINDKSIAGSWFSVRIDQPYDSSTILIPITEADQTEMEERRQAFTNTNFLDYRTASFAYQLYDQKQVRVELPYQNDDSIQLDGFNGTLGTGGHTLTIRHAGETDDGRTRIEVEP